MDQSDRMPRSQSRADTRHFFEQVTSMPVDQAVEILEELGRHPDLSFRCRAFRGMIKVARERARAMALRFLDDPEGAARFNALYFLWETGDPAGMPAAAGLLASDPDEDVRSFAAFYLGVFGDESVLPVLETAVEQDPGADHEGEPIRNIAHNSILRIQDRLSGRGGPDHYPSLNLINVRSDTSEP